MALIYAQIDCDLPRDPRMIRVGPMARLLYIQFVLYSRENLTDGEVERVQLPIVSMDIPRATKCVAALVDVGALEITERGWRIPRDVWVKRNPLREQVESKRKEEADRKKSYRDRQRTSVDVPTGQSVTATSRPRQEETETKTEEETKPSVLTLVDNSSPSRTPTDGLEGKKQQAVEAFVATSWAQATQSKIGNRAAFLNSERDTARAHPRLDEYVTCYPSASASEIANWLRDEKQTMRYHPRIEEVS